MKLNNHLIVSLPDFSRHFNFIEFYGKRKQFIRDLNPNKAFYWNDNLKNAFNKVQEWIFREEEVDYSFRIEGLNALDEILGGTLNVEEATNILNYGHSNIQSEIISVLAGENVRFLEFDKNDNVQSVQLGIHKIEVMGTSESPANIYIGENLCGRLRLGEIAYITEVDGKFIELLPNHLYTERWDLKLLNNEGCFFSSLMVQNLESRECEVIEGVISFAIVSDGYIYIDDRFKPVFFTEIVPQFMLKQSGKSLCVKSNKDNVLMLYSEGILRTTIDIKPLSGIRHAYFNSEGIIKIN